MSIVRTRKIGLHHVAFFRCFFEGSLDIKAMANRYLETGSDIVAARETLKMIQDAFVAAALKIGHDADASWLVLPESTYRGKSDVDQRNELAQNESSSVDQIESFESWSARKDPGGFFSIDDMLQMYEDEFAEELAEQKKEQAKQKVLPPRTAISADDLARRINIINELSQVVVSDPAGSDGVDGWFSPAIAQRLKNAGLHTLSDILDVANEHGFRWFRFVPKLGEKTASKITSWLAQNDHFFERPLSPLAVKPRRERKGSELAVTGVRRYGITTLENLDVPHPLSGVDGSNRADLARNKLRARNDFDAIQEWLGLYTVSHTFLSYRKEAERLLLWAVCHKQVPLSSLSSADMAEFFAFLRNPPDAWCSERRYERYHPGWKPFVQQPNREPGAPFLSDRSVGQARTILSTLFEWLVSQNYLDSNPIKGLPQEKYSDDLKIDHSFTKAQWMHVVEHLKQMPLETEDDYRMRFLIVFAYGTGLRLHEITKATLANLALADFDDVSLQDAYMLKIVGKGKKKRSVPVPRMAITALQDYLEARGLSRQIRSNPEDTPLISNVRKPNQPVSNKTVHLQVKAFFAQVAQSLDPGSEAYARFKRASTHWLRHTYGSHAVSANASLPTIQENMGHASLSTTSIYVKSEDAKRWKEMESFMETGFGV